MCACIFCIQVSVDVWHCSSRRQEASTSSVSDEGTVKTKVSKLSATAPPQCSPKGNTPSDQAAKAVNIRRHADGPTAVGAEPASKSPRKTEVQKLGCAD